MRRSLNIKNKDKALIQHEDKTSTKQMGSTPQIQVEEQSLTLKKRPRSKHWQTECRRTATKGKQQNTTIHNATG